MQLPLYIGLNGYIGSGKDTVAKMLYCILNNLDYDKDSAYRLFKTKYSTEIRPFATISNEDDNTCTCIAFADSLKKICSDIFGIPTEYFYYKKSTGWICINKDFEYTETEPDERYILSADEYYCSVDFYSSSSHKYYMDLRNILVYVGTYLCQYGINRSTFVNSVRNNISSVLNKNKGMQYIICTDIRFNHEFSFIKENNGIMINISRNNVLQMKNIAEHELDMLSEDDYDYTIHNDGTYEELFDSVWNLVHNNVEFNNDIQMLDTRDFNRNTYVRKIADYTYRLCTSNDICLLKHSLDGDGSISYIDINGGPIIEIGKAIPGTHIVPTKILYNPDTAEFIIIE